MKGVSPRGIRDFSKHVLECPTHSRKVPEELSELQDYLKKLSYYVEKYDKIKCGGGGGGGGGAARSGESPSTGGKGREMSFSVRESFRESPGVQIIEMTPPEEVTVISGGSGPPDENRGPPSSVSGPGADPQEPAPSSPSSSDESVIGIYFINDVKPANMISVIQRELCTLGKLYPSACDIIGEITSEFEHFKACCVCLRKVTPLLSDILKELQELIKFIKKRRNEAYVWPNDSEYLRKKPEGEREPFKKTPGKKGVREETVGYLTVRTKLPEIIRQREESILGEDPRPGRPGRPESVKKCSVRLKNRQQLTLLQSETQSDLRILEKAETVEMGGGRKWEVLRPTEFSTAQILRSLNPVPVVETALQYRLGRNSETGEGPERRGEDDKEAEEEEVKNDLASKAREFLLTARVALGEACTELRGDLERVKMEKDTRAYVKDLRDLMLEVHRNQMELSKVLLEKGFLSPAVVQFTDPGMLLEEREGMRMAKDSFAEAKLDNPEIEKLRFLVEELKAKCKIKNRMIMALLKGVKGNIPKQHCEELVNSILQETDSVQQMGPPEKGVSPLECGPSAREWKKLDVEEVPKGINLGQGMINSTRISYSEVISKSRRVYQESPAKAQQSFGREEPGFESGRLAKDPGKEIKCLATERERSGYEAPERRADRGEVRTRKTGSATINLTIKIGDEDLRSRYLSAVSVGASGAALVGKKSEISLPSRTGSGRARSSSLGEFASCCNFPQETRRGTNLGGLALKFKLPLMFKDETGEEKFKVLALADYPKSKWGTAAEGGSPRPVPDAAGARSSSSAAAEEDGAADAGNDLSRSDVSILYPQMDGHCEQNRAMKALRSRLVVLEDDLRSLRMTIDRMSILTDKLVDDAYESSQNFKEIFNCYRFTSDCINN